MQVSEVSRRYAKALYLLAEANEKSDAVLVDLQTIRGTLNQEGSATRLLNAPVLSLEDKKDFIDSSFGGLGSTEVKDFLKLLVDKDRVGSIAEIVEAYEQFADESKEVMRGVVRSASPVADTSRQGLEQAISNRLNKKVLFQYEEDPEVLGGIVAEVGSYLFDGSVDSQIRMLNEELTRSAH